MNGEVAVVGQESVGPARGWTAGDIGAKPPDGDLGAC